MVQPSLEEPWVRDREEPLGYPAVQQGLPLTQAVETAGMRSLVEQIQHRIQPQQTMLVIVVLVGVAARQVLCPCLTSNSPV